MFRETLAKQVLLATLTKNAPEVDQGPNGAIKSPSLLGSILVWNQLCYQRFLKTVRYFESS